MSRLKTGAARSSVMLMSYRITIHGVTTEKTATWGSNTVLLFQQNAKELSTLFHFRRFEMIILEARNKRCLSCSFLENEARRLMGFPNTEYGSAL